MLFDSTINRPKICNFIKKDTLVQMFFCEFPKFLGTTFL